jgi:transposase
MAGDLSDDEWARLEPLLPSVKPRRGGRWRDHRQVINGILWRVENGAKWDEVPERYGPGKTCYDRFARWEQDGTWARIEQQLQADADAAGELNWNAQAGTSIMRVHQHAAGARKRAHCGRVAGSVRDRPVQRRPDHQTASAGRRTRS